MGDDANTENEFLNDACTENKVTDDFKAENEIKGNPNREKGEPNAINEEKEDQNAVNEEKEDQNAVNEEKDQNAVNEEKDQNAVNEEKEDQNAVNEEKEDSNVENRVMKEFEIENEIIQNAVIQNVIEKHDAENEVGENANSADRCMGRCSGILKEKLKDKKFFHKLSYFVYKIEHYMKRRYDIFKRRSSDVESGYIDLPVTTKLKLQNYVTDYRSEENLGKHLPLASPENRRKLLDATFYKEIIYCCSTGNDVEIMKSCAVCFFEAFDLQEIAGFENAVHCANIAIASALFMADSSWIKDYDYD